MQNISYNCCPWLYILVGQVHDQMIYDSKDVLLLVLWNCLKYKNWIYQKDFSMKYKKFMLCIKDISFRGYNSGGSLEEYDNNKWW